MGHTPGLAHKACVRPARPSTANGSLRKVFIKTPRIGRCVSRHSPRWGHTLAVCIALGLTLTALGAPASVADRPVDRSPASLATIALPFPFLEGPQVKVDIGYGAPAGPAMSFVGGQNAWVNFSVWWWDNESAANAYVIVDGGPSQLQYPMAEAPGGDGVYANGTLYVAMVNATEFSPGPHTWHYEFLNQTASAITRLPQAAPTEFGTLVLDRAEMFTDQSLTVIANTTLAGGYASGTLATLRDVVNEAVSILDPQMSSHWNGTEVPYDYLDENHNITGPVALTVSGEEVFVGPTGLQQVGFGDGTTYPGNSQPAHKQTLALRSLLLQSGLFNESDLQVYSDMISVNNTTFYHPYLRVALLDGSEQPGDGTADNDSLIDVDLWGLGLSTPVNFSRHFGDQDNDTSDDVPWSQSIGWPPVNDSQAGMVLWPRVDTYNVTTPSGQRLTFSKIESTVTASATQPLAFQQFWRDEPILFDGLPSTQSMFLDLRYTWTLNVSGPSGADPVWVWEASVSMPSTLIAYLTVTDVLGNQATSAITIILRSKTELRLPVPDASFYEDSYLPFDLRGYFGDDDGFNTIQFNIQPNRSEISVNRDPPTAPNMTFTAQPDWCGEASVTIDATDGVSPVISATFNLTVRCLNDPPVISDIPSIINMSEDGTYILTGLSSRATDADGDIINWSLDCEHVTMEVDPLNDTMIFRAAVENWFGSDGCGLTARDGADSNVTEYWAITFIIEAVNDPPQVAVPIPTITLDEDAANQTLYLADYFIDPDFLSPEDADWSAVVTADPGMVAGYFPPLRRVWFHPAANYSGPTGFTILVRDSANASVSVHVNVTVTAINDPPAVVDYEPKGPVAGTEGDLIIFVVQVIDSDSPIITYTFSIDGEDFQTGTGATFEWQTDFHSAGFHTVEVVARDSAGGTDSHTWQAQIVNSNQAPSVSIINLGPSTYQAGQTINLTADAFDPDGEPLTYNWNFGGVLQPMTGQNVSFKFTSAGNNTVKVTVSDGELTASASIVINVEYYIPCSDPNDTSPECQRPPPTCEELGNCPPTPFLPGAETVLTFAAVAVAAALLARRRRRGA